MVPIQIRHQINLATLLPHFGLPKPSCRTIRSGLDGAEPRPTLAVHQTGYPDWDAAMAREDYAKLNAIIVRDAEGGTRDLQRAWGGGGSQGIKGV